MILIINTSGEGIELLLEDKHKKIQSEKQAVALPVETEKFLSENNATWQNINAMGVVVGPGSFTGIRLGIAYTKGIAMGLNIPVIPINAFELYLDEYPNAFVAIESGRGDFFVGAKNLAPCTMDIDTIETKQMEWPQTVGHKPFDLKRAIKIVERKLADKNQEPVVPLYLRPSYAEENAK